MGADRIIAGAIRLGARLLPLKGWTLVTETLHPHIANGVSEVVYRTPEGLDVHLDFDEYIQRSIFYGAYEPAELAFTRAILRPGDVMVDVGANLGIFTLVAARQVGDSGQVHAFEPVPANFRRLCENVALNGFGNVLTNQLAAGPALGELRLGLDAVTEVTGTQMSGGYAAGSSLRQLTVPMVPLDRYVAEQLSDRPIRLVKVDVEGYESEVLRGMRSVLSGQRVDFLILEINVYALSRVRARIEDVVDQLREPGYQLYRLFAPRLLRRWSYRGEPAPLPPGQRGELRRIVRGIRDLKRNFNLIAVRRGHPAVTSNARFLRISRLARA
jgi:FkbM family methyltransferase